jgi:hypothetical protein
MSRFWAVSSSISSLVLIVGGAGTAVATCWTGNAVVSTVTTVVNSFEALLNSPLALPNALANSWNFRRTPKYYDDGNNTDNYPFPSFKHKKIS